MQEFMHTRFITSANARELAAKSAEARRALSLLPKVRMISKQIAVEPQLLAEDGFREMAKIRVREQFTKLQDKIDQLLDCRDLDVKAMRDLADASLKLESIEQKLSGRAGPGTLKPTNRPQRAQTSSLDSPEPASSVVHTPTNSVPIQEEVSQETLAAQSTDNHIDAPSPPVV